MFTAMTYKLITQLLINSSKMNVVKDYFLKVLTNLKKNSNTSFLPS